MAAIFRPYSLAVHYTVDIYDFISFDEAVKPEIKSDQAHGGIKFGYDYRMLEYISTFFLLRGIWGLG